MVEQVSMHLRNMAMTAKYCVGGEMSDCDGMRGQASEAQVGGISE
jgi:hypothetical protein